MRFTLTSGQCHITQRRENATMRKATETMHRIGLALIHQRRAQLVPVAPPEDPKEKSAADSEPANVTEHSVDGKDLLSVLSELYPPAPV